MKNEKEGLISSTYDDINYDNDDVFNFYDDDDEKNDQSNRKL